MQALNTPERPALIQPSAFLALPSSRPGGDVSLIGGIRQPAQDDRPLTTLLPRLGEIYATGLTGKPVKTNNPVSR